MKQHNLAVVIGRNQLPHKGHGEMFKAAINLADHVLILVGSSFIAPNIKNPFPYATRKQLISGMIEEIDPNASYVILPLIDNIYSDQEWVGQVQSNVATAQLKFGLDASSSVVLVGHHKDTSSYYLDMFPQWADFEIPEHNSENGEALTQSLIKDRDNRLAQLVKSHDTKTTMLHNLLINDPGDPSIVIEIEADVLAAHQKKIDLITKEPVPNYTGVLNSTDLRVRLYETGVLDDYITSNVTPSVADFLKKYILTEEFENMRGEYDHIKQYKQQFANYPYPPIFVTADSVMICNGHILLIRRRAFPGKGLWALPGGFLNQLEWIRDAIIREALEETRIRFVTEDTRVKLSVTDRLLQYLKKVHVFDAPNRSFRGRTITHAGLFVLDGLSYLPKVRGSDDAERAKWVPLSEFWNMREQMFEDHYQIASKLIGMSDDV